MSCLLKGTAIFWAFPTKQPRIPQNSLRMRLFKQKKILSRKFCQNWESNVCIVYLKANTYMYICVYIYVHIYVYHTPSRPSATARGEQMGLILLKESFPESFSELRIKCAYCLLKGKYVYVHVCINIWTYICIGKTCAVYAGRKLLRQRTR